MRILWRTLLLLGAARHLCVGNALQIYVIDDEGGKSLLYVVPGCQTLLVDAGYTGFDDINRTYPVHTMLFNAQPGSSLWIRGPWCSGSGLCSPTRIQVVGGRGRTRALAGGALIRPTETISTESRTTIIVAYIAGQ